MKIKSVILCLPVLLFAGLIACQAPVDQAPQSAAMANGPGAPAPSAFRAPQAMPRPYEARRDEVASAKPVAVRNWRNDKVYIAGSNRGKAYHLETCSVLAGSEKRSISRGDAETQGYAPCKLCHPDASR